MTTRSCARVRGACLLLTAACCAVPAVAQSPASRQRLQQLLSSPADAPLLPASLADAGNDALARTMRGMALLRSAEPNSRRALDRAHFEFDEAILRAPDSWPWPWYGLALSDLALDSGNYVVKASMHQGAGVHYHDAALLALAHALDADSSFVPAARLLGDILVPYEASDVAGEVEAAVRRATTAGAGPSPWLAYGRLFRNRERPDSSAWAFRQYLAHGGDSGLGQLELARALSGTGDSSSAVAAYFAGAAAAGSLATDAYRQDVAWVATPEELSAFDSLVTPASRERWVRSFWFKRDAEELRAPGERLLEHFRRWRYVFHHFRLVDRATGTPQRGGANCGPGAFPTLRDDTSYIAPTDLQLFSPGVLAATTRGRRIVDDRGLVYMRHGEPDGRAAAAAERTLAHGEVYGSRKVRVEYTPAQTETRPNESWKYVTPQGILLFHFCGSMALGTQAATTLVQMLPLNPEMLGSRSGLDPRFAALEGELRMHRAGDASTSGPASQLFRQLASSGAHDIKVGLSTDGYPPKFAAPLHPQVQFYALGSPGQVLVVFAMPGSDLTGVTLPDRGMGYPLRMRMVATDVEGRIARVDTVRRFRADHPLSKGEFLYGLATMPIPSGRWNVRVLIEEDGTDAGGAVGRLGVVVPARDSLAISDLVLGREGSGLSWQGPDGRVALNPLDAYERRGEAELYYEVIGLEPAARYVTDIAIAPVDEQSKGAVHLTFTETSTGPLQRARRSIGLEKLEGGQYRLTVTVRGADGGGVATQSRLLNVRGR